ncbi:hypothetical protein JCM3765_007688 [Sporobolomyces pararoseus]
MQLTNELIKFIFEGVYDSLCYHPAQSEPDYPIGAKFVFSNFSLVSKTWHRLSLPLLVRHFDGENVEGFAEFIEKHNLASFVRSFYFNPKIIGWTDPKRYEKPRSYHRRSDMRADAIEKSESIHRRAHTQEKDRWIKLIELCFPHLVSLEIGERRRDKSEEGSNVLGWDARHEDWLEMVDFPSVDTSNRNEYERYLFGLKVYPNITTLRLNLSTEPVFNPSAGDYIYDLDDQMVEFVSTHFPSLKNYTLHFHNEEPLACRRNASRINFPKLDTLRLLNARSDEDGLDDNIRTVYLAPSASTLRHLEMQVPTDLVNLPHSLDAVFKDLHFPLLETLTLDAIQLHCEDPNFLNGFPSLQSLSLSLSQSQTTLDNLPFLSVAPNLQVLQFSEVCDSLLPTLVRYFEREDLSSIKRLVLQDGFDLADEPEPVPVPHVEPSGGEEEHHEDSDESQMEKPFSDEEDAYGSREADRVRYLPFPTTQNDFGEKEEAEMELRKIIDICERNGVEFCYGSALRPEEGDDGRGMEEPYELDEPLSEDEDFDFEEQCSSMYSKSLNEPAI